jgi:hypothetical protein
MFSGFQPLANRSEPHRWAPDCRATVAHPGLVRECRLPDAKLRAVTRAPAGYCPHHDRGVHDARPGGGGSTSA